MNQLAFGKLVSTKRKLLKLSQVDLGKKIWAKASNNAAQKMISNIENGVTPRKKAYINQLCKLLSISPVPKIEQVPWQPATAAGLFVPEMSEADILLVSSNSELQDYLNKKLAEITKIECERFRDIWRDTP